MRTYIDQLCDDSGCLLEDLPNIKRLAVRTLNVTASPTAKYVATVSVIPRVANRSRAMSRCQSTEALLSIATRLRIGEAMEADQIWQQKWSRRTQISVLRLCLASQALPLPSHLAATCWSIVLAASLPVLVSCHGVCWWHIINLPWHRVTSNEDKFVLWKMIIVGCQVSCVKYIYY